MKKDDYKGFLKTVDTFLEENKYESGIETTTNILKAFTNYYEQQKKPISEYQKEDFDAYLKANYNTPQSSRTVRSNLGIAFKRMGLNDASEAIRATEDSFKTNYFKDFETLDNMIESVRREKFTALEGAPVNCNCDSFTMSQVILYLTWIGVPKTLLTQMPLSSINTEEKYVDGGRKYSYADNPKIAEVFEKYKNADSYTGLNTKKGKPYFRENPYQGDTLIRTRSKPTGSNVNIATTLNRIKTTLGDEKFTYYNVFRSGQFYRGFQKLTKGILPEFSDTENLWEYFGVRLETDSARQMFNKEWKTYLKWRQTLG